jgi:hypothetical protein
MIELTTSDELTWRHRYEELARENGRMRAIIQALEEERNELLHFYERKKFDRMPFIDVGEWQDFVLTAGIGQS